MSIKNEADLISAIKEDEWMMNILRVASTLKLPDWWICAGFIRSKVWDNLHHFNDRTPIQDIDVIYFDSKNNQEDVEKEYEKRLLTVLPSVPWSVKNQARMHELNKFNPFSSSTDGISHFPETATAIGIKLEKGKLKLTTPVGIQDLVNLEVKPTVHYIKDEKLRAVYQNRIAKKDWKSNWTKLKIYDHHNQLMDV